MKKIVYSILMLLCVLSFTSCSKDDDNDNNGEEKQPQFNPELIIGSWGKVSKITKTYLNGKLTDSKSDYNYDPFNLTGESVFLTIYRLEDNIYKFVYRSCYTPKNGMASIGKIEGNQWFGYNEKTKEYEFGGGIISNPTPNELSIESEEKYVEYGVEHHIITKNNYIRK